MEKKVVTKKKPQSRKDEIGQQRVSESSVEHEGLPADCQTRGETAADIDSVLKTTKTKCKKRNASFEEDVIDGFLIVSYASLEDLEADGPIKPGAILAGGDESSSAVEVIPSKKRRDGKSAATKAGKSAAQEGQKKKKVDKSMKKPKAVKTEKCKSKTKKGKEDIKPIGLVFCALRMHRRRLALLRCNILLGSITKLTRLHAISAFAAEAQHTPAVDISPSVTATKPDALVAVTSELDDKSGDMTSTYATEKILSSPSTPHFDNSLLASGRVNEPRSHVMNEESFRTMNQSFATTPNKENKEFPLPRKPLSDFSINAIQSMRGTASNLSATGVETTATSTSMVTVTEEMHTQTKSIATMTSDQKQDKSISPMEVIMRKETGFQFRRFEETKISASIGAFSPGKSPSISFDDTVIRKSLHQIDLTGTSTTSNEKTKLSSATIKGREMLRRDTESHSPKHYSEGQTPSSNSLSSSNKESTKHQHQHQHIHQHQHSHQHQHFHPPFGMVPNGVFPPSYYSGMSYLPPMSASTAPHSHMPKPLSKPGKWCSLHVKIAHYITKAQKEAERVNTLNSEAVGLSRTGLHAFQAVPSRSSYERDFPFPSAVRPHLPISPKSLHHSGLMHGAFPRESDRHSSYHLQGRPHPYFPVREGLGHKRPEFEHLSSSFSGLGHSAGSSYRGLFGGERSSPPHLEAIFPRRNSELALADMEKTNRLLHHENRAMLNLSSAERDLHHESERHRRSSFMDRDKTAYFQPVKLDAPLCRSSLASHVMLGCDIGTRKPSPRRVVSPLASPLVGSSAQKAHFRSSDIFDRFHPDALEHRGLYGNESRLVAGESRLLGSESRLFAAESRLMGSGPEPRFFGGADKRISSHESRLFGVGDARKGLLPFAGHNTPLSSSGSHAAGILSNLGRMSSKFTSSS
eukprot:gene14129-15607_t